MKFHVDFETRSPENLKSVGAFNYAMHPETDILVMAYAFDDGPIQTWGPKIEPFPSDVIAHLNHPGKRGILAHNAQFERAIINNVLTRYADFTPPPLEAYDCTAATASARSYPRDLDGVARALNLRARKDPRGRYLISQLSKPHWDKQTGELFWNEDPELLAELIDYCVQDVIVERQVSKCLTPLTEAEHEVWLVSEKINELGIPIDLPFVERAAECALEEAEAINAEISAQTGGKITSARQVQRLKGYIEVLLPHDRLLREAVMRRDKKTGEVKISLDRAARDQIREIEASDPGHFPEATMSLMNLMDSAQRSSTAKYKKMMYFCCPDGRIKGAYIYYGAQTGRYSGKDFQPQNLPRKTAKDPEALRAAFMRGDKVENCLESLSSMVRPSIMAGEGFSFVGADYSGVEARCLAFGAGDAEDTLNRHRVKDQNPDAPDTYQYAAADIYGVPVAEIDSAKRQVGKTAELACGYGGGVGAFRSMAKTFGLDFSEDQALEIVREWRNSHPWAPKFWKDLEKAAIDAVLDKGELFEAGRFTLYSPPHADVLLIQLPSRRILSYPKPVVKTVDGMFGEQYELHAMKASTRPKENQPDWPKMKLYGGLLAENVTQAMAADLLTGSLVRLDQLGMTPCLHTHDEILIEVPDGQEDQAAKQLRETMLFLPDWAEGLPLNCETWTGKRYQK